MNTPRINVTPLIDVLLVLLIIFMVVAPIKPSSFKAKVPTEPVESPARPEPNTLVVAVDKNLGLSLNQLKGLGTVDDPSPLVNKLKALFGERQTNGDIDETGNVIRSVFIKAPRNIGYGKVVKVIDAVKSSGADPLALQIDYLED